MRDVQRFLASPWSIYSLNITASSEFQINAVGFAVNPVGLSHYGNRSRGITLAHSHNKSNVTTSLQVR